MSETAPKVPRTIWIGLSLVLALIALALLLPKQSAMPVMSQVTDFTLTNQLGQPVTLADLRGRVWVADIIFTRCPGPCARMTRQMQEVQAALPRNSQARLISLTTDPEFDTPEVLARYAERFNADPARWHFLTGGKLEIAAVAVDGLKLTALEKKPEERTIADDLFIHSTIFVLVDKQGRLRWSFETDGENVNWPDVKAAIVKAVRQLEREP